VYGVGGAQARGGQCVERFRGTSNGLAGVLNGWTGEGLKSRADTQGARWLWGRQGRMKGHHDGPN